MRPLILSVAALLSCAVVAGCASSGSGTNAQANSDPAGNPSSSSSGFVSPGHPTNSASPSGTAVPVSGPIGLTVLSLAGPVQPAGPYLGTSVQAILEQMAGKQGIKSSCPAAGCWADAKVPAGSLLLAVRPATVSCNQLHAITVAKPAATTVRIDLQLNYVCRVGEGSAARATAILFALPQSALSPGALIEVRSSPRLGQPYQPIGSARLS